MNKAQAFDLVETLRTAIQHAAEWLEDEDETEGDADRIERALDILHAALAVEDEATKGGAELVK